MTTAGTGATAVALAASEGPSDAQRATGPRDGAGGRGGGGAGGAGRASAGGGITAARVATAAVLADVRAGELLDPVFDRRTAGLDPRDRRWARELVWGMLRRRAWLDAILGDRVRGGLARLDPDLADLLRLGVHQLLYMGSVPAYAGIAQTVELAKRRHGIGASKLANAVLRRVDRDRDDLQVSLPSDPVESLATRHSHPAWLVRRWVDRFGAKDAEELLLANNREAAVYARPWGVDTDELELSLRNAGVETHRSPHLTSGLRLERITSLTELGAFRQGQFFMQDPAATLVTEYAALPSGALVADMCAAPGGKALELARTARMVVASDRSENRVGRIAENAGRLGAGNVFPVVADAREPVVSMADGVLLDVPCTGTGTFRRHPDARWRIRISDLAVLGALQRELLVAAAQVVRSGGYLVYSTCSLEPEENEVQVNRFLGENPEWRLEPPQDGVVPAELLDGGLLRVLPQRHGVDGAFAARLRRHG